MNCLILRLLLGKFNLERKISDTRNVGGTVNSSQKFLLIGRVFVFGLFVFGAQSSPADDNIRNRIDQTVNLRCGPLSNDDAAYLACSEDIEKRFLESQATTSSGESSSAAATLTPQTPFTSSGACEARTKEAQTECNFVESKSGKQAIAFADGLRNQIKMMSMSSPVAMCGKMGEVSQTIDLAVGAYDTYCTAAYSDCDNACTTEIDGLTAAINQAGSNLAEVNRLKVEQESIKDIHRKCKKLSSNVGGVFQNISSFTAIEMAKSQYCKDQGAALAALCKAQPSNALCQTAGNTDCSNPTTAANNIVCICQVNKADPRCTGQALAGLSSNLGSASGAGSGASDSSLGGSGLDDFGGAGSGFGLGGDPVAGVGPHDGSSGPPSSKGQPGRGSMDLGGNGNSPAGKNNAAVVGGGQDPTNAKILNGYGVGGNTGARGGYYGSGSGANLPGPNGYSNGKPGAVPVDLRKFLPGGKMDPTRGLAGISGPDGITGPNTDIWDKIKLRYYNLQPSLLP